MNDRKLKSLDEYGKEYKKSGGYNFYDFLHEEKKEAIKNGDKELAEHIDKIREQALKEEKEYDEMALFEYEQKRKKEKEAEVFEYSDYYEDYDAEDISIDESKISSIDKENLYNTIQSLLTYDEDHQKMYSIDREIIDKLKSELEDKCDLLYCTQKSIYQDDYINRVMDSEKILIKVSDDEYLEFEGYEKKTAHIDEEPYEILSQEEMDNLVEKEKYFFEEISEQMKEIDEDYKDKKYFSYLVIEDTDSRVKILTKQEALKEIDKMESCKYSEDEINKEESSVHIEYISNGDIIKYEDNKDENGNKLDLLPKKPVDIEAVFGNYSKDDKESNENINISEEKEFQETDDLDKKYEDMSIEELESLAQSTKEENKLKSKELEELKKSQLISEIKQAIEEGKELDRQIIEAKSKTDDKGEK